MSLGFYYIVPLFLSFFITFKDNYSRGFHPSPMQITFSILPGFNILNILLVGLRSDENILKILTGIYLFVLGYTLASPGWYEGLLSNTFLSHFVHSRLDAEVLQFIDMVTIGLTIALLLVHWGTEIKWQLLLNKVNLSLFIIGLTRLVTAHVDDMGPYLGGLILGFIVPYLTLMLRNYSYIGGGVLKLLICAGLLLGTSQIMITLAGSFVICHFWSKYINSKYPSDKAREIFKKYPSGYSVLMVMSVQLVFLTLT